MHNRSEDLSKQYHAGVEDLTRTYRAGVDSLREGYETARDHYAASRGKGRHPRPSNPSSNGGSSVWGVLALATAVGAAAIAAAPHLRRYLDAQKQKSEGEDGAKHVPASAAADGWPPAKPQTPITDPIAAPAASTSGNANGTGSSTQSY